jgi:hypothetical protein
MTVPGPSLPGWLLTGVMMLRRSRRPTVKLGLQLRYPDRG